ncbi:MAG: YiiG family protein [Acidobacteriaceae bacterium]|nr:YiiG family protein [Acidobacteriaceae bacterium]
MLIAIAGAYMGGVFDAWLPKGMKAPGRSSSVTGEGEVTLQPQDEQLQDKLQPLISCINSVAIPLGEHAGAYREEYARMLEQPGATRNGQFKMQVFEQNNSFSRDCIKGLKDAIAMSPADAALDDPSKQFADTLEQLIPLMNEADDYYHRKDNLDDKMKKGKALDSLLMPLFDRFFPAADALSDVVSERNQQLRERRLVALEQTFGKDNFAWHLLNVSIAARHAMDGIDAAASAGTLSADAIETIEKDYQTAYDAATAFAEAHADTKTSLGNSPVWFSLSSNFNNFLGDVKEFRRLLATKPNQELVSARLSMLRKDYNDLIRDYNMIARRA